MTYVPLGRILGVLLLIGFIVISAARAIWPLGPHSDDSPSPSPWECERVSKKKKSQLPISNWRTSPLMRAFGWMFLVSGTLIAPAGLVANLVSGDAISAVLSLVIGVALVLFGRAIFLAPFLSITNAGVEVGNPWGKAHVDWDDLAGLSGSLCKGLTV